MQRLMFLLVSLLFITGCQSPEHEAEKIREQVEWKEPEEVWNITKDYEANDYKEIYKEIIKEANQLTEDEDIRNWLIREIYIDQVHTETELTDDELLTLANYEHQNYETYVNHAEEEYGVQVSEEEVNTYIDEVILKDADGINQEASLQGLALALDVPVDYIHYEFDRPHYVRGAIMDKLLPQLEKKYDTTNQRKLMDSYVADIKDLMNK